MSTASIRPALPLPPRPAAAAPAPAASGVTLDPVRLLKKYYLLLGAAAVVGAVLGTITHFVLARTSPQYTSTATFACFPATSNPAETGGGYVSQDELRLFMGTQMAMMVSTPVLDKVLNETDVQRTAWAQQFVYNNTVQKPQAQPELERALSVKGVPQTSLIRLSMTWRRPDDVRTIVDAVCRVYQAELSSKTNSDSVQRRQVLTTRIRELDSDIKVLNDNRDHVLEKNQITDIQAGLGSVDVKVRELSQKYVSNAESLAAAQSQYDRYRKIQEDGAVAQYPDNLRELANRDPVVAGLDQQISGYRTDHQTLLKTGLGPMHLTVIAARKRIDAAMEERQDAYDRAMRRLFDAELESMLDGVNNLQATKQETETELAKVETRRQDLTRLRLQLQDIADEVARKTEERAHQEAALNQLKIVVDPVFDRVKLWVPAQKPDNMSFPRLGILMPLGVVLVAGLVGGLVLLREILDQRVRGPADLSSVSRVRVLGIVSDAQEDPARPTNLATAFRDTPTGVTAESFRLLRAPIVKAMDQGGHKSLLVLAGMPGSGATIVATNLALACAGADERVLVIDANLRRPGVQRAFGLGDGPGLGDVLAGASRLDDAVRPTSTDNLYVLTVGSASHRAMPERLASDAMARLLNEAKDKFDRIFIDSAPAIVSGDGFTLANRADAVALVVRAMSEKRGLVARLRAQLGECHGEFLGVIVNAVRASAGGYLRGNIRATHEYQHGAKAA